MKLVFPNARVRQHLSKMGMPLFCFGVAQQWRIAREYISATAHHESTDERELSDRALARAMWHSRWATWSLYALVVLIFLLVFNVGAHAQLTNVNITKVGNTSQTTDTLKVNCVSGCGGGSSNATIISPLDLSGNVEVSVQNATIAITASSLPLPSGASTEAKQDTGNSSLASIDGKVILPSALDGSGYLKMHEQGVPHTICDSGCGGGASFTDNSAFTFGTTAVNNMGAVVDDVSTNAVAENSSGTPRMSTNRVLFVDLKNTQANTTALNVTLGAETTKTIGTIRVAGTTGSSIDGAMVVGNGPTNGLGVLGKYNNTRPVPSDTQTAALQIDQAGNLRTMPGLASATLTVMTSVTALNNTQTIYTNTGAPAVLVLLSAAFADMTGGAITFEVSYDNSAWLTIPADAVLDPTSTTLAQIPVPYTVSLTNGTSKAFLIQTKGWQSLRLKVSTVLVGSGQLIPSYTVLPMAPASTSIALSPTAANFNATVVGTGTFATQSTLAAETTKVIGTVNIASAQTLGTVTAVTAITNALPTGTNTIGSVKLTDGTTVPGVIAATTALKVDTASVAGTATPTGNGTVAAGVQRVAIASDNTAFAVNATLQAGTAVAGKFAVDQTTPGTTNAVEPVPDTSTAVALSASGKATVTTSVNVKSSAGNVYGFSVTNGAAGICWIQFVNNSGNGTLGTLPIFSVALPASGTVNYPPGNFPLANFSSGIAVGISTAVNGASACGTAGNITVFYK